MNNHFLTLASALLSFTWIVLPAEQVQETALTLYPETRLMQLKDLVAQDESMLDEAIESIKADGIDPLIAYAYFKTPESIQRLIEGINTSSNADLRLLIKEVLDEHCYGWGVGNEVIKEFVTTLKRTQRIADMRGFLKILKPAGTKKYVLDAPIYQANGGIVLFQYKKNDLGAKQLFGRHVVDPYPFASANKRATAQIVDQMMIATGSTDRIGLHLIESTTFPGDTRPGLTDLMITRWENNTGSLTTTVTHIE